MEPSYDTGHLLSQDDGNSRVVKLRFICRCPASEALDLRRWVLVFSLALIQKFICVQTHVEESKYAS